MAPTFVVQVIVTPLEVIPLEEIALSESVMGGGFPAFPFELTTPAQPELQRAVQEHKRDRSKAIAAECGRARTNFFIILPCVVWSGQRVTRDGAPPNCHATQQSRECYCP